MQLPERINLHLHELSDADKSIWRFIESHKETACRASIHDLARLCAVSSASVVRFAQKLGFEGFGEMKAVLKMELEERGKPDRDILTSLSQFYDQSWRELMARDYRGASRLVHEAHRVFAYASGYVQTNVMQELKRLFLYDNVFICGVAGREEFYSVYQTAGPDDLFVFISLSGESERVKEFSEKLNLKGVPRSELPKPWDILKERGHLAIPLVVIIYLLVSGFTPMRAALWAIVLAIAASSLRKSTRMKPVEIVRGLENGARNVLGVLVACASAGIIIGVVTKAGVGLKLASALLDLSGGMLLPTMFFTMITSIILGMGVPTTANYVITSTIAAPALVQMGVPVLAAHMFVFYFGIIADVTPPVALAAFAGSAISGGKPLKTGINASKLAIAAFIIPYIFVLSPVVLMIDATPISLITVLVTSVIGMVGLSASMIGCLVRPLNAAERVVLFVGGLLMIQPGLVTDLVGFLLLASVLFWQQRRGKAEASSLG